MILAIITLVILLSLIGNKIYPALKETYCAIIRGMRMILPLPTELKTDVPNFCKKETQDAMKVVELETQDPEKIAFNVAAYIAACWEITGKVKIGQDKLCYELIIKKINAPVTESMVRRYLSENQQNVPLMWSQDIEKPKSIAIKYNSQEDKIEVL